MKNAEKKKRGALSVSWIDLVILVIAVLLGFFIYEYVFTDTAGDDSYEIDYVVKVSAIRSELSDRINVGDSVYDEDGFYMGRVTAYERRAAVLPTTGQTMPGRFDIYITIETQTDGDGTVAGTQVYAERELALYTPGLYFEGVCISVKK